MSNSESIIIKHVFSYEEMCGCDSWGWSYLKKPSLWCETNLLSGLASDLQKLVPHSGSADNPMVNAHRLAMNMLYDMYNNGGGNACRWSITKEFKQSIRKAKLDRLVIKSLEKRLSEVFKYVCRGRNFGWPQDGQEALLRYKIECFATDVIYYAAEKEFPEKLKELID